MEGDPQPHDREVCELVVREEKAGRPRAGEVGEDGLSAGPVPCAPSQASSNLYFRFRFRGSGWAEAGAGLEGAAFPQAPTRPGGSCTSRGADPRGQTDANMPPLCRCDLMRVPPSTRGRGSARRTGRLLSRWFLSVILFLLWRPQGWGKLQRPGHSASPQDSRGPSAGSSSDTTEPRLQRGQSPSGPDTRGSRCGVTSTLRDRTALGIVTPPGPGWGRPHGKGTASTWAATKTAAVPGGREPPSRGGARKAGQVTSADGAAPSGM